MADQSDPQMARLRLLGRIKEPVRQFMSFVRALGIGYGMAAKLAPHGT